MIYRFNSWPRLIPVATIRAGVKFLLIVTETPTATGNIAYVKFVSNTPDTSAVKPLVVGIRFEITGSFGPSTKEFLDTIANPLV